MVSNKKIKIEIQNMDIDNVDKILSKKYKVTVKKLQTYPEGIKRDLLYDLEKDFQYFQERLQTLNIKA